MEITLFCNKNKEEYYILHIKDVQRFPQLGEIYTWNHEIDGEQVAHYGIVRWLITNQTGIRADIFVEELVEKGMAFIPEKAYKKYTS